MLSKHLRMKSSAQFDYIFKKGKTLKNKNILIFYSPSKQKTPKFGIVVSKKIGKSTTRNAIKRKIREIIKENLTNLNNSYNYVFIARSGIENLSYTEISCQVIKIIKNSEVYV